jgi:hypothetical protein
MHPRPLAALVLLLLAAPGCFGRGPAPPPSPSRPYTPPPNELVEIAQEDPVLVAFCVAEEKIIGYLTPVISDEAQGGRAARLMRRAARQADLQSAFLRANGRREVAREVRRWAGALRDGAVLAASGSDGYDALRLSLLALNRVERAMSCEVDL